MTITKPVLYAASVAPLADAEHYAAAYAAVSPARQEKVDRFRFEKDKRLSLGAELLLRHALHCEGLGEIPILFDYGAQGKPRLKDCSVYFNLSHSGEYVVCALAPYEVGCDVEQVTPIDLNIARRFFFRSEYDDIAAQTTQRARNELFFRCWTLKESFMKVTGLGMKLPLDAFEIVRGAEITVRQSVDTRQYSFAEFDELSGYRCALCTAGDCRGAVLHKVDLAEILLPRYYIELATGLRRGEQRKTYPH